jgi:hypothetical protein
MVFLVFPSGRWPKPTSHLWRCSNCFYDVGLEDEQYHEKKHNIYIYPNNYLCYFEDFWSILIHCSCLIFRKFLEKKHQPNHEWPLNFWMIHWSFHRFALVFWRILHDSHYVPQILHRLSWLDVDFPYVFHIVSEILLRIFHRLSRSSYFFRHLPGTRDFPFFPCPGGRPVAPSSAVRRSGCLAPQRKLPPLQVLAPESPSPSGTQINGV